MIYFERIYTENIKESDFKREIFYLNQFFIDLYLLYQNICMNPLKIVEILGEVGEFEESMGKSKIFARNWKKMIDIIDNVAEIEMR